MRLINILCFVSICFGFFVLGQVVADWEHVNFRETVKNVDGKCFHDLAFIDSDGGIRMIFMASQNDSRLVINSPNGDHTFSIVVTDEGCQIEGSRQLESYNDMEVRR